MIQAVKGYATYWKAVCFKTAERTNTEVSSAREKPVVLSQTILKAFKAAENWSRQEKADADCTAASSLPVAGAFKPRFIRRLSPVAYHCLNGMRGGKGKKLEMRSDILVVG